MQGARLVKGGGRNEESNKFVAPGGSGAGPFCRMQGRRDGGMKNNRAAVTVWKILFAVILVLTVALWCVLMAGAVQHDQADDVFGPFLTVELGVGVLIFALVEELVIYAGVKYFLRGKDSRTRIKTTAYITLLGFDFLVILLEAGYIFSYISTI